MSSRASQPSGSGFSRARGGPHILAADVSALVQALDAVVGRRTPC